MGPNTQLAQRFFAATAAADAAALREICAAQFTASQNNGPSMNVDALIGFTQAVVAAVDNFRYENPVRAETQGGFVEEHDVACDLPDGTQLNVRLCVVADVSDGKITSMREYVDGVAARGLAQALEGAA